VLGHIEATQHLALFLVVDYRGGFKARGMRGGRDVLGPGYLAF
jgi:hypothetical protein